jgi:hypothetical protein
VTNTRDFLNYPSINFQNGVRLKLPSKSGSLSIRSRGNGIDFNYLTPPPTTTPQNEEEETEI